MRCFFRRADDKASNIQLRYMIVTARLTFGEQVCNCQDPLALRVPDDFLGIECQAGEGSIPTMKPPGA